MFLSGGRERSRVWRRGLLRSGPLPWLLVALTLSYGVLQALSKEKGASPSKIAPYRWPLNSPTNLDQEIRAYEARLASNPESALDRALLAKACLQKARRSGTRWYERAQKEAQESLAQLPYGNPSAKLVLAQVCQARHEFVPSLEMAEEARRERPGSLEALSVLALGQLGLGRVSEAARLADELVFRSPTMGSHLLRGLVSVAWGREAEASYSLARAIELEEPGDMEESSKARTLLGRLHLSRGRLDPARDLLIEAIRIDPGNPQARALLGDLELREGHFARAGAEYAQAFQLSGEAQYLAKKARALRLGGNPQGAAILLREAESLFREGLARNSYGHRRQLAELLLERQAPGDAEESLALLQAEALKRRDGETLGALGRALSLAGRFKEAQAALAEAIRSNPQDAGLCLLAAGIERGLGNRRREEFYREEARAIDPSAQEAPASPARP